MQISNNGWVLSLDLNGGRIQELSHKGIRIFGTYRRIDGKMGSTHICVPSFDKEGQEKYGLPFHGLVRNTSWEITKKSNAFLIISCETLPSNLYPAKLLVEQEFNLKDNFIHTVRVSNSEGRGVPANIGCHYYWDTPHGWDSAQINNEGIKNRIMTNGFMDLNEKNNIVFPHASYELTSRGFHSAVLWTSFMEEGEGNKKFSQDFCCIEPVIGWPGYFGTETSMVKAGETKTASITIGAGERTC